jgi:hypothetical protein
MPSMTITIERTPLTLKVDGREVQVEKLGIRLPFGRKPTDLTDIAATGDGRCDSLRGSCQTERCADCPDH